MPTFWNKMMNHIQIGSPDKVKVYNEGSNLNIEEFQEFSFDTQINSDSGLKNTFKENQ